MKKLLLSLLLIVCLGASAAFAEEKLAYTIEFKATGNNNNSTTLTTTSKPTEVLSSGADYVSKFTVATSMYVEGWCGARIGTNKNAGELTLEFSSIVVGNATKMVVGIGANNASKTININSNSYTTGLKNTTKDVEIALNGVMPATFNISKDASQNSIAYINYIKIYVDDTPAETVVVSPIFTPTAAYSYTEGAFSVDPVDFFEGVANFEIVSCDNEDTLLPEINNEGKFVYTAGDPGTANVTVTWAEGTLYKGGEATFVFTVSEKPEKGTITPVFSMPETITEGDKGTFTVEPADFFSKVGEAIFVSDDNNILTVDNNGSYTAVAPGTTTVTVTWDESDDYKAGEAEFEVTVKEREKVAVEPVFSPLTLVAGAEGTFTVEPADFFEGVTALMMESDNEDVLLVDDKGYYFAGAAGSATVTVMWGTGSKYLEGEAEFTVTVEKAPEVTAVAVVHPSCTYDGPGKLDNVQTIAGVNNTVTVKGICTISGFGATTNDYRVYANTTFKITPAENITVNKVVFKDKNNKTVTISVANNNGEISTSNRVSTWIGSTTEAIDIKVTAQIQVTYFEIYYTKKSNEDGKTEVNLEWNIENATATIGQPFDAPVLIVDNEDAKAVVEYSSSNSEVADIDENGNITLFGKGTTTITAFIAEDNENYEAHPESYILTVIDPREFSITSSFLGNKQSAYNKFTATDKMGITYEAVYSNYMANGNIQFNPTNANGGAASAIVVTGNKNGVIIESITINFEEAGTTQIFVYADWQNFASLTKGQKPVIREGLDATATVKGAAGALSQKVEIGATAFALIPSASVRISSVEVKYSDNVMPTTLYLHGHFSDSYFDLSKPLKMEKTAGMGFIIYQVYFGSEDQEFSGYDPEYVFTTHCLPAGTPASARRRVSGPHTSDWSDLTEGKVYHAAGVANAADITSHDQLSTFAVPEAGKFYDIHADFSTPDAPIFTTVESRIQTGVEGVLAQPAGAAEYYDMMGHRVVNPAAGVYIRVQDGKATKVMINE